MSNQNIQNIPCAEQHLLPCELTDSTVLCGVNIYDMKLIPLSKRSKNPNKYFAQVDDEDFDYLMQWNWSLCRIRHHKYAIRHSYNNKRKRIIIHMHTLLLNLKNSKLITDHIDGNGLNNCRSNLRICTYSQNAFNRRKTSLKKSSLYKGVHLNKDTGLWRSSINIKNVYTHLGYFSTEIDAAIAFNHAALRFQEKFAYFNPIDNWESIKVVPTKNEQSSKYRGVFCRKSSQQWEAVIHFKKKAIFLGSFSTEIEAVKAYNKKAIELKLFSRVNKIKTNKHE